MISKNAAILKQLSIFNTLNDHDLEGLAAVTVVRRYKKGMIIFMEGEPGDALYFVRTGRIKLSKMQEDGREQILHYVQDGDIFAEVLLFDGGTFPATAEVMEDAEIGIINNKDLDNALRQFPDAMLQILHVMAKRLRQAQLQIRDLALKDTNGRLVSLLLKFAREYGVEENGVINISLNITQQEMANLIGSSRETVARLLGDLKRMKIIDFGRNTMIINDMKRLQTWG